jgi:hypothetical protein
MFERKLSALFLLLSATIVSAQTLSPRETAPYRGVVYAGPVFGGANPSNATFGSGGGGSFRAYRWIEVAGDFSVYLGTGGVANNTMLYDYLIGPRLSVPLSQSSRLVRLVISWLAGKSFTTASPNTRITTETGVALH